jgi:hypothetical protein
MPWVRVEAGTRMQRRSRVHAWGERERVRVYLPVWMWVWVWEAASADPDPERNRHMHRHGVRRHPCRHPNHAWDVARHPDPNPHPDAMAVAVHVVECEGLPTLNALAEGPFHVSLLLGNAHIEG